MLGDILQGQFGHFFRDNADGTCDALSSDGTPKVDTSTIGATATLVRDGKPTGEGDRLAARVAVVLARRYA